MKKQQVMTLVESMLASISEIMGSVVGTEIEHEKFIDIGSYFYRASLVLMEFKTTESKDLDEILQSLCQNITHGKDLLEEFLKDTHLISNADHIGTVGLLEDVIKQIGECLSKFPNSIFEDKNYVKVVTQSLSDEMHNISRKIVEEQGLINEQELQTSLKEKSENETETIEEDLYPIDVDYYKEDTQSLSTPPVNESVSSPRETSQRNHRNVATSLTRLPSVAHYIEPLFETFFCPLTKDIMDDPVSLETGVTYERWAITEWFEGFENSEEVFCPVTEQKVLSRVLNSNRALKSTIDKWKERNEIARIKVARAALSLASSNEMVLEAIEELLNICKGKQCNLEQICKLDMVPLLVKFLEYSDKDVRFAILELLLQVAEINDDSKKMICKQLDLSKVINLLLSSHQPIRSTSLLLLLKLSGSQSFSDKIGSITGGISTLITIKCNRTDEFASKKADEVLRNIERSPTNIKHMAENGFMEPLLRHLIEGNEMMRMEMASYLGRMDLKHVQKMYVAEKASPTLVKMVHEGNAFSRKAAFKALAKLSSHKPNVLILAQAGTVPVMVEEIFARTIYDELNDPKTEAAGILANICEYGLELDSLLVNTHGRTMSSDYVVYNTVDLIKNSTTHELSTSLIRILLCLTKFPKPMATIVSCLKDTEAIDALIEFINSPHEELSVAAIKLLVSLSSPRGYTIAERLCKTRGILENLIRSLTWTSQITEKQALSATFLAKLPHQNLTLNSLLVNKNIVPNILLPSINQIQSSETRTSSSRYASDLLEGLVGILVRFTTTFYEPQMLLLAKSHNFTSLFTSLLTKSSSDEVQKLSAIGLENLSSASMRLSNTHTKRNSAMKVLHLPKLLSVGSSRRRQLRECPVHRGPCSSQNTLCLVHGNTIERLLTCLEHENGEVVEAALSAICTLVDDKVDVEKGVNLLREFDAVRHVLKALRVHKQESLWHKALWLIEKFLIKGGDKSASDISQDRMFPAMLITAFHNGGNSTSQIAESILKHLNKIGSVNGIKIRFH